MFLEYHFIHQILMMLPIDNHSKCLFYLNFTIMCLNLLEESALRVYTSYEK